MADKPKSEYPEDYYKRLVGEEFTGRYAGDYNRNDWKSANWYTIKIDKTSMSDVLRSGLADIESKFEGKIWKGIWNNALYVREADHGKETKSARKFRIIGYNSFDFKPGSSRNPVLTVTVDVFSSS